MVSRARFDSKPWYKQFWFWFVVSLPIAVVIAGFNMLYIAMSNPPSMVVDDYYKEGLAINQSLQLDKTASALNLVADVQFDVSQRRVSVIVKGSTVSQSLLLKMMHPTSESQDADIVLTQQADGVYIGQYDAELLHRYYLRLLPLPEKDWRIDGEINFSEYQQATLTSQ